MAIKVDLHFIAYSPVELLIAPLNVLILRVIEL